MNPRTCAHCGDPMTGRARVFCSDAHRKRAYRRRLAGIPEHAYPAGASRGSIPLDRPSDNELRTLVLELRAATEACR